MNIKKIFDEFLVDVGFINPASSFPSSRQFPALAIDPNSELLIIHGGLSPQSLLVDNIIATLDISGGLPSTPYSRQWTPFTWSDSPSAAGHALFYLKPGHFALIGGKIFFLIKRTTLQETFG
jgi:hypothetical protein